MPVSNLDKKVSPELAPAVPDLDRLEEEADECEWEKKFAATPDEKLNKLVEKVRATIEAGKTGPLDFTNR